MEDFVIGLDVDDLLAGFSADVLVRLYQHTGRLFTVQDLSTWDPFDSLPPELRPFREIIFNEMKQEGACYALPVEPGAQHGVERLRRIGHVVAITHPFKGAKTWAHERELWLDEKFGMHRDDVYFCKKKHRIHVDVYGDDKEENVQDMLAFPHFRTPVKAVLWGTPMNRNAPTHLPRITGWDDFVRFAEATRRLKGL